jgi:hypothetical protein
VDPRAGLDAVKKRKFLSVLRLELRPLDRPARSESLYRIRDGNKVKKGKVVPVLNYAMKT